MGRLSRLLSFVRTIKNGVNTTDVKSDPGGGFNITSTHFADPGDDSYPLENDLIMLSDVTGEGRQDVVGYMDPKNSPKALKGDKRIYGRDGNGNFVNEVWLKNDGSILISNGLGSIELDSSGTVTINGVTVDLAGNIIAPKSLVLSGVEVKDHTHSQGLDSGGNVQVDTDPIQRNRKVI